MLIKFKQNKTINDIEVLIEYPEMNDTVSRIESAIKAVNKAVKCLDDNGNTVFLKVSDIFYIESIEKRIFIYAAQKVFQCDLQLYQLLETLTSYGFVQISKSCILNLNKLLSVKPIFNAKMEATLVNGERLNISRKYLPDLKKKLEKL